MKKIFCEKSNQVGPNFSLPNLPYEKNALEPFYTAKLLDLHHGKHHNAYVNNLNTMIVKTNYTGNNLEEIIINTHGNKAEIGLFNNAAQIWNHTFFWHCMTPNHTNLTDAKLLVAIDASFGSYEEFRKIFIETAVKQFGSGWCWLVKDGDDLKIISTSNAETPLTQDLQPLLTVDVWEHAYYPDYENRRPEFVEKFIDNLVNWEFVSSNFSK
jgi:superoxide dismutase, Fe-Mn family